MDRKRQLDPERTTAVELLIVRHASAGERDPQKWPDDRDRPVSPKGARRFRSIAHGLARLIPEVDAVWSSPLRRAWQTAEILQKEAGWPAPREFKALEPGNSVAKVTEILRRESSGRVVLVGHEPMLSQLITHLTVGPGDHQIVELKKGGAALLSFPGGLMAGNGVLLWLLPPRVALGLRKKRNFEP
jgi:phosphohistidine phosphatase